MKSGPAAQSIATTLSVQAFGVVMFGDGPTEVFASASHSSNDRVASRETIESFFNGFEIGMRNKGAAGVVSGERPGSRYDLVRIGGAEALKYRVDLESESGTIREFLWSFPGAHGITTVTIIGISGDEAATRALAEKVANGIEMKYRDPSGLSIGETEDHHRGVAFGKLVPVALVLVVLFAIGLKKLFFRRKKA
jgi:hypothetical protein